MSPDAPRTGWYRYRATFGRRWTGYLTVVLLLGLVGGLAMASVAGARLTLSSPAIYAASTNPFSFGLGTGVFDPQSNQSSGYDPTVIHALAHLPQVSDVVSVSGLNLVVMDKRGDPVQLDASPGNGSGSVDGGYLTKNKVSLLQGRMFDPGNPHEFVVNTVVAQELRLHVGQVVPFGIYTNAQTELADFGSPVVRPFRRIDIKLVGIVMDPAAVAADQADIESLQIFTPALTRQLLGCCANYTVSGVKVDGGPAAVDRVQQEALQTLPKGSPVIVSPPTAAVVAKAERSVKPVAIALGVFGGIAGLVALIVASQVIGRQIRFGAEERRTLRALGAGPTGTMIDGLLGPLLAAAVGSLLAVGVAVALSPLAPLGVFRPVYPDRGVAWDWTTLGIGLAILLVGSGTIAVVIARRQAPQRLDHRRASRGRGARADSSPAAVAAGWGLPVSAVEGVHFALDPGTGRDAVPVRSAIFGTVLAVWVLVATVTFGASLDTLVSHPNLYGWNWDYALVGGSGSGDLPAHRATTLLGRDPFVASWSGAYFANLTIDGQTVPAIGGAPGTPVQPPVLSGHGLAAPGQIVLGPVTLATLGKRVGDTVVVDTGSHAPVRLRIVGTATMPTIGNAGELHLEMGTGALLASAIIPASDRNPFADPQAGPEAVFIRLKHGGNQRAAVASLQRIADATSTPSNFGVAVAAVQKPAEIVNYRSLGTTPLLLGSSLAAGAVVALGFTLVASVRRRRHELAVLKTLGFTHRQLAAAVSWQSSVSVVIGVLAGVPFGVISGRWLWNLFATEINAVPAPTVPVGWIIAIALGSLVLANLVALIPAQLAARTSTSSALRAD